MNIDNTDLPEKESDPKPSPDVIPRFVFIREEFINNLNKLGGWSCYGSMGDGLEYYLPEGHEDDTKDIKI